VKEFVIERSTLHGDTQYDKFQQGNFLFPGWNREGGV
jgi:hypothetical protein